MKDNLGRRQLTAALIVGAFLPLSILGLRKLVATWNQLTGPEMADLYSQPLKPPHEPLHVFHLGHSLVGRDMPAMLAQLAPTGHRYESQLGWGTTLKAHWGPEEPIAGFETENAHPRFRLAREALSSGDYDAFILTEMVELRDAIRYFESWRYLLRWAQLARKANPAIRLYLYETWHSLKSPEGWLARLDGDFDRLWDQQVLRLALSADKAVRPIYVIPAGQVLSHFVRRVDERGGVLGLRSREDLFARTADGSVDDIHMGDLGNYLVALTHYAVLYQRSPVGLPRQLNRADGAPAVAPSPEAALLMQESVWDVVTHQLLTGLTSSETPSVGGE